MSKKNLSIALDANSLVTAILGVGLSIWAYRTAKNTKKNCL